MIQWMLPTSQSDRYGSFFFSIWAGAANYLLSSLEKNTKLLLSFPHLAVVSSERNKHFFYSSLHFIYFTLALTEIIIQNKQTNKIKKSYHIEMWEIFGAESLVGSCTGKGRIRFCTRQFRRKPRRSVPGGNSGGGSPQQTARALRHAYTPQSSEFG